MKSILIQHTEVLLPCQLVFTFLSIVPSTSHGMHRFVSMIDPTTCLSWNNMVLQLIFFFNSHMFSPTSFDSLRENRAYDSLHDHGHTNTFCNDRNSLRFHEKLVHLLSFEKAVTASYKKHPLLAFSTPLGS